MRLNIFLLTLSSPVISVSLYYTFSRGQEEAYQNLWGCEQLEKSLMNITEFCYWKVTNIVFITHNTEGKPWQNLGRWSTGYRNLRNAIWNQTLEVSRRRPVDSSKQSRASHGASFCPGAATGQSCPPAVHPCIFSLLIRKRLTSSQAQPREDPFRVCR